MAKFKVGDRVKATTSTAWYALGSVGTVKENNSRAPWVDWDDIGTWAASEDELVLLPVAEATSKPSLMIETGKFFRTHDGRKVGPMERWNHAVEHPWQQQGGSAVFAVGGDIWRDDGSSEYGMPQLIAEWVDEPASNDNTSLTTPAIVALIENGQPKPSEQPKVHKSEQAATDEAERLAVKYPGQKFGVFVLADSRIADVVIRRAA